MKITRLTFGFLISLVFMACEKDDATLIIPNVYDGVAYETQASTEITLRNALASLSSEMEKGRTSGVMVDAATLTQLYVAGSPSLSSITTNYYQSKINGTGAWLEELEKASGNKYLLGVPQGEGGVFGSYLLNENGLELEQMVEKGLFAAAMYNQASTLMGSDLELATVDRLVALFGAHPNFSNSDNASTVDQPDQFSAKYAARRDKNDGTGLYTQMRDAFIKLQAALAEGNDFRTEQEEALTAIKTTWEKIIFATVVNYCHTTISKLSGTNPSESDQASGLHNYSEAVGFTHGWREINSTNKTITDAQIDELLELLNAPYDGTPTSYTFVTDPVNELPKLSQVIDEIQNIYGFSDQDIQDFKENWVSKQGR